MRNDHHSKPTGVIERDGLSRLPNGGKDILPKCTRRRDWLATTSALASIEEVNGNE